MTACEETATEQEGFVTGGRGRAGKESAALSGTREHPTSAGLCRTARLSWGGPAPTRAARSGHAVLVALPWAHPHFQVLEYRADTGWSRRRARVSWGGVPPSWYMGVLGQGHLD